MGRRSYKGEKRSRELARQRKQAQKREKRLSKRSGGVDEEPAADETGSDEQPAQNDADQAGG